MSVAEFHPISGSHESAFFLQFSSMSLFRYSHAEGRGPIHVAAGMETAVTSLAALGMGRSSFTPHEFPCF